MPTRTCIGCRAAVPDQQLVRVTELHGNAVIGVRGRGGRGAWIHPDVVCVEQAGSRRAFSRAFRRKLADGDFAATLIGWLADQGQS
jgi:predicted RNA-binding protein YlxR (DUF448 family)